MRKHFTPYRPVMRCIRTEVKPVPDVFLLKDQIETFILFPADILIAGPEDDAHFPEIRVIVAGKIIHRVVEKNSVVIKSVGELLDVKRSAHRKTITGQVWMAEGRVHCMV